MKIIERRKILRTISSNLNTFPVVAILGPRQSGKTTLARTIYSNWKVKNKNYFDLENPVDLSRLDNPFQALSEEKGFVVIDEIQRKEDLFPILRILADRKPLPCKFLLLGSASGDLLRQSSESLAGRIGYINLSGFCINEINSKEINKLWIRGGFPRSFLATSENKSVTWRRNFVSTFLEQDLPTLGIRTSSQQMRRFWMMAAHYHGQIWSHSELARSLGVNEKTIKSYLDILTDTYMVRQLPPWFENLGKRIVKSPKFYFRDSGIFHSLMNFESKKDLFSHPKLGASWEGFALEQIIHLYGAGSNCYFWRTHAGAELDLLIIHKGRRLGFEFKYTDAPSITKSMRIACEDLKLNKLFILYPGTTSYKLEKDIEVKSLEGSLKFI